MLLIILLIAGGYYFSKRLKLKPLTATDFPEVPVERFNEWKQLELNSIDIFLWASWGLALIGLIVRLIMLTGPDSENTGNSSIIIYALVFWGGLIASAVIGSKAKKLKQSLGIVWPKQ